MNKKLPIGVSDFRKIIEENYYYIDKSIMIQELVDSGSEVLLFPRPRRFGKTLNLSMLRYFYEKTDADTSGLFRDLQIWEQGDAYRQKQGKHPVISLTFKDIKCDTWEPCMRELCQVIGEEYRRHRFLTETDLLDEDEKVQYRAVIEQTAGESAYRYGLKKLSGWLSRHYGANTVILIDEYDTPIQQGYLHGYYNEVIGFMRSLLSGALKDNVHLEKGALTGILRIAKESIFSGLNNVKIYSLLDSAFGRYFGLLEEETEQLLRDHGVEEGMEKVRDWYNGYTFGDQTLYNPWSILNYAESWRTGLRPHWVNTSSNDLVRQLLTESGSESKRDLEQLMRGQTIRKAIEDTVVFRDLVDSPNALWSFLLFSGYLTVVSQKWEDRLYGELRIPNREVAYLYRTIIQDWFERSIQSERHRMMLQALTEGDVDTFEPIFGDFVRKTFSQFDPAGDEPEKVYHAFVLGLLIGLEDRYEVKSNRESGYGRYDVMLIPRESGRNGVILEFKKVRRGETLEEAAAAALRQIEDKRYESELQDRGIRNIVKLGIAFAGKQVRMEWA